jgi:hypothetical protein
MASCLALLLAGHDILSSDTRDIEQRWPQHGRGGSAAGSNYIAILASSSVLGGALVRLNFEHMGQMPAQAPRQSQHNPSWPVRRFDACRGDHDASARSGCGSGRR